MSLSDLEAVVTEQLEDSQEAMEDLLSTLVGTNSHTANADGVNEVGRALECHLLQSGLRTSAFVTGRGGQHMVARTRGGDGNRLLLLGHLDTVFPLDEATDGFAEDPDDPEKLLGPGVTDMKGGLVVMAFAVRALAEAGALHGRALTMLFCADEETGSPTGRDLIETEARDHHLCLVFETGQPRESGATTFVTGRKGMGQLTIDIEGVESHAGVAKELGVSAAVEMAEKIRAVEGLNGLAPGISVTAGLCRAGTAANTVPGRASIEVDYRFASEDEGVMVHDALMEVGRSPATRNEAGVAPSVSITWGPSHPPLERTDAIGRMADRIVGWGRDLDLDLVEESRGGASDGNITAAAGCPTVCGLGTVGGRIHSGEEWMWRRSLVDRARLLAVTMLRFWDLAPRTDDDS